MSIKLFTSRTRLRAAVHQNRVYWRYVENFRPWFTYKRSGEHLDDLQKGIVRTLKRDGIAITTVRDLVRDFSLFEELQTSVATLQKTLCAEINRARENSDASGFKTYLVELLGPRPVLNPDDLFVQVALQPSVLGLVNAYFGMYTRLRAFNVWHTFPSKTDARNSQLWHRDPEDQYIIKMFVYLTDVNEENGPLTYAPGTHPQGRIKSAPESSKEKETSARRSNDAQMSAVVPKDRWITAVGPKDTIVFADTRGYHKGGLVRSGERVLYNCMFTSQASTRSEYFERHLPIPDLPNKALAFALGGFCTI